MIRDIAASALAAEVLVSLAVVTFGSRQRGRRRLFLMRSGTLAGLAGLPLAVLAISWATKSGVSNTLAVVGLVATFGFGLVGGSLSRLWSTVTVAVVITSRVPFFRELRRGLREGLDGLHVTVIDEYDSGQRPLEDLTDFRPALRRACKRLPDFLVICCPSHVAAESPEVVGILQDLTRRGGAAFFVEDAPPEDVVDGLPRVYTVESDSEAGARVIGEFIASRLRDRELYLLCGPEYSRPAQLRRQILSELLPDKHIVVCDLSGWTPAAATRAATDIFATCATGAALICGNDSMALGAVDAARLAGRDDVVVLGYDGIRQALVAIAEPRNHFVATLRTPPSAYGHEIAARIRELLGAGERTQPKEELRSRCIRIPVDEAHLVTETNVGMIIEELW